MRYGAGRAVRKFGAAAVDADPVALVVRERGVEPEPELCAAVAVGRGSDPVNSATAC